MAIWVELNTSSAVHKLVVIK